MLKRTTAVTRVVLLLGTAFALRQLGLVLPVNAQDICSDPLSCFYSCEHSQLGVWQCYQVCNCWIDCKCFYGKDDSTCFNECTPS